MGVGEREGMGRGEGCVLRASMKAKLKAKHENKREVSSRSEVHRGASHEGKKWKKRHEPHRTCRLPRLARICTRLLVLAPTK